MISGRYFVCVFFFLSKYSDAHTFYDSEKCHFAFLLFAFVSFLSNSSGFISSSSKCEENFNLLLLSTFFEFEQLQPTIKNLQYSKMYCYVDPRKFEAKFNNSYFPKGLSSAAETPNISIFSLD